MINGVNNDNTFSYAYDLDYAGDNDLITDAAQFLSHLSVSADYLSQKYYSEKYQVKVSIKPTLQKSISEKMRTIKVVKNDLQVTIEGIGSFGTLHSRKLITQKFAELYYNPLLETAQAQFKDQFFDYDNHLKAGLFLRLMGGYDLTKMDPMDQLKMLGLIYKTIGTNKQNPSSEPTFNRFLEAL